MLKQQKHREVLFNVLRDIYRSSCAGMLGFKGGTMLYFFHALDRFSVDLDFDLLPGGSSVAVSNEIRKILRRYGTIDDEAEKISTLFFLLRYEPGQQGVKVEISQREQPLNTYETKNFYGIDVITLSLEDSFAHKLVAATERTGVANRDFYDIWYLLSKSVRFNEDIITARTNLNAVELLAHVRTLAAERISAKTILEGIGELVDENQKHWLKSDFKNELLALLDFAIDERKR
ncbi:MAG: nucleotidyl transferase AbiEii/AbiGii toxin family protein [Candidatus Moraniibacteriota bacterium]